MQHIVQKKAGNKEQGQRKGGQDREHRNKTVSKPT